VSGLLDSHYVLRFTVLPLQIISTAASRLPRRAPGKMAFRRRPTAHAAETSSLETSRASSTVRPCDPNSVATLDAAIAVRTPNVRKAGFGNPAVAHLDAHAHTVAARHPHRLRHASGFRQVAHSCAGSEKWSAPRCLWAVRSLSLISVSPLRSHERTVNACDPRAVSKIPVASSTVARLNRRTAPALH